MMAARSGVIAQKPLVVRLLFIPAFDTRFIRLSTRLACSNRPFLRFQNSYRRTPKFVYPYFRDSPQKPSVILLLNFTPH